MDDVGYADVGYASGSGMLTPNIDSLRASGVALDRYYAQPVCSPTRSALMQGRFPFRTGLQHYTTLKPATTAHMPLDVPTVAELLNELGYRSHAIGKWHLGYAKDEYTPMGRGFESHVGYYQGMEDYFTHSFTVPDEYIGHVNVTGYDWWRNGTVDWSALGNHSLPLMMRELDVVLDSYAASGDADADRPLFLYFAHQIAHVPLEVPPGDYLQRCKASPVATANGASESRLVYCAMMAALDAALGDTVQALKSHGMWDDTLLVVTTDNGGAVPDGSFPESAGCNYPLRAGKGRLFEGGVRAVGFVNGGDNVVPAKRRGTAVDGLSHVVDWLPTLLSAARGADSQLPPSLDGRNLMPALFGGEPTNRSSIALDINNKLGLPDFGKQAGVLADDGWKLIIDHVKGGTLVYDGYFYCNGTRASADVAPDGLYLFNVLDDPNEHTNLYAQRPDQVARLQAMLDNYVKQGYMNPQFNPFDPLGFPERFNGVWAPFLN
jgi:arylsulfatase A-like enzyme